MTTPATQRMASVIFDCDSTLSSIEGIEYLSGEHRAEVERLTQAAMDGDVPLESVYGRRLELVRPDRAAVDALGRAYIASLVPDAREVVHALAEEGVAVRVISGGLLPAVQALARELGLQDADVAATPVYFDAAGGYAGFDTASPLARSGGKLEVLQAWRETLPKPIMLVGDGVTDLEARPAVDVFVAFAGVVEREAVTECADCVIRSRSLAPVLPLALPQPPAGERARATWEKGLALLEAERKPTPS